MKLKRIEIRTPDPYNPNCKRVQFYLNDKYKTLLTLQQTDNESDSVLIVGAVILEANGNKVDDTIFAYILGITEDDQPFIFEPYQELITITEISVFKFKNVVLVEENKNADRTEANT